MLISGLQKLTLLDFPGYTACTIFTLGCNLRCPFCQNKSLVLPECFDTGTLLPIPQVFNFLKERRNRLQGVCITGGEPTLQPDLTDFIRQVRKMGYRIKLDTNGTRPDTIQALLQQDLLDYIAMDIKNDLPDYSLLSGKEVETKQIQTSIDLIKNAGIPYEFRTTVVQDMHSETTFQNIAAMLGHVKNYSLQYYHDSDDVIQQGHRTPSDTEMAQYRRIIETCAGTVFVKGR